MNRVIIVLSRLVFSSSPFVAAFQPPYTTQDAHEPMKQIFRRRSPSRRKQSRQWHGRITPFSLDDESLAHHCKEVAIAVPDRWVQPLDTRSNVRLLSTESELLISRVNLSPLTVNLKSPTLLLPIHREHPLSSANDIQNPQESLELVHDISSAARAYLPTSTSLLTTTTSHERLCALWERGKHGQCDGEEIRRTWPSSILFENASSPIRATSAGTDAHGDGVDDEGDEVVQSEADLDVGCAPTTIAFAYPRSRAQRLSRVSSSTVLRGASHAQRHRESMLLSHETATQVDEFGQLIGDLHDTLTHDIHQTRESGGGLHKYASPNRSRVGPTKRTAELVQGSQFTFGNAASRNDHILRTPQSSGFGRMRNIHSLHIDTSPTIRTSDERGFFVEPRSPSSASLSPRSMSIRSHRFVPLNDIFPSPSSSTFRFPSLCVAAIDQATASKARSTASSLASARAETEDRVSSTLQQLHLLGSPIRLQNEIDRFDNHDASILSATSQEAHVHSPMQAVPSSSVPEEREERLLPAIEAQVLPKAHSDSHISTLERYRPQAFGESQSAPSLLAPPLDEEKEPLGPPKVIQHQRDDSLASIRTILQQQEATMLYVRSCLRCSPAQPLQPAPASPSNQLKMEQSLTTTIVDVSYRPISLWTPSDDSGEQLEDCNEANEHATESAVIALTATDANTDETLIHYDAPSSFRKDQCTQTDPLVSRPHKHYRLQIKNTTMGKSRSSLGKKPMSRRWQRQGRLVRRDFSSPSRSQKVTPLPIQTTPASKERTRLPGICISLATPRNEIDDDEGNDDDSESEPTQFDDRIIQLAGLGIDEVDSRTSRRNRTPDTTLLMPPDEDSLYGADDNNESLSDFCAPLLDIEARLGALQCDPFDCLMEAHFYDGVESSGQGQMGTALQRGDESVKEGEEGDGDARSPPMRVSTTSAAIEAMLEHLHRAQNGNQGRLCLSQGGRRHERKEAEKCT